MCIPVAAAAMAATAISAAGTAFAGYTAFQQAKVAEATANINRNAELAAAQDARERGSKEEIAHYRQVAALKGRQTAAYAAQGLDVAFGSPADVITDTAVLGNEDAQTLRDNTLREMEGHRINAANYQAQADSAKFTQQITPFATAFGVGSTLLGGYGKAKGYMNVGTGSHGSSTGRAPSKYSLNG